MVAAKDSGKCLRRSGRKTPPPVAIAAASISTPASRPAGTPNLVVFSMKMKMASSTIAATFISPTSASTAINDQQHARHHAPCSAPARRSRTAAGPVVITPRIVAGDRHLARQASRSGDSWYRPASAKTTVRSRALGERPGLEACLDRAHERECQRTCSRPDEQVTGHEQQQSQHALDPARRTRDGARPERRNRSDGRQHHRCHHRHPHRDEWHERHAHRAGCVAHRGRICERSAPRESSHDEQRDPARQGLTRGGLHALYATSAMNALDMP